MALCSPPTQNHAKSKPRARITFNQVLSPQWAFLNASASTAQAQPGDGEFPLVPTFPLHSVIVFLFFRSGNSRFYSDFPMPSKTSCYLGFFNVRNKFSNEYFFTAFLASPVKLTLCFGTILRCWEGTSIVEQRIVYSLYPFPPF